MKQGVQTGRGGRLGRARAGQVLGGGSSPASSPGPAPDASRSVLPSHLHMDDKSYRGSFKGRGTGHTGPVKANAKLSPPTSRAREPPGPPGAWRSHHPGDWRWPWPQVRVLPGGPGECPLVSCRYTPLQTAGRTGSKGSTHSRPPGCVWGGGHGKRDHLEDWVSLQAHLGTPLGWRRHLPAAQPPSSGPCLAPHPPSAISSCRPQIQGAPGTRHRGARAGGHPPPFFRWS